MKNIINHIKEKWFKYALDTLVVVVGVLIAFSMSNWSENQRIKKLERSTLIEISHALESDLILIGDWIRIAQLQDKNISTILDFLKGNKPSSENLSKSWQSGFLRPFNSFNTSPYELLKSRGLDIIADDKIRRAIQKHYDISIPNMIDYKTRNYNLMNDFRNKYMTYLVKAPNGVEFEPTNLEALRSEEMLNGLSMVGFWHQNRGEWLQELKVYTEKLHAAIEAYLEIQ